MNDFLLKKEKKISDDVSIFIIIDIKCTAVDMGSGSPFVRI